MRASSFTINNLIERIPRQLTGRYNNPSFPLSAFNEISDDLEKSCNIKYLKDYFILPMEDQVTRYKLDQNMRNIRGVYLMPHSYAEIVPNASETISVYDTRPNKNIPVSFDVHGDIIEIRLTPNTSDPIIIEGRTIVDDTGSSSKKLYDIDAAGPLALNGNLRGMGIVVTFSDGTQNHFIIANGSDTEYYVRVDGEMDQVPDLTTSYSIYRNFFIIEYVKYLPRLIVGNDNSQSINVPLDFEPAYKWGMFWKYYAQEGENKVEIDRYENMYNNVKNSLTADRNKVMGDNRIAVPRSIPKLF